MLIGTQKIRLSQIRGNIEGVANFEEQLERMRGTHEEKFTATEGQKTFTLSKDYIIGRKQLLVYLNGMRMSVNDDYIEVNSRMISFIEPLYEGDFVLIRVNGDISDVINKKTEVFEISRESFYILAENENQVTFNTQREFALSTNSLEVYLNGSLLERGLDKDYIELDSQTFKLNYTVPTGSIITTKIYGWY